MPSNARGLTRHALCVLLVLALVTPTVADPSVGDGGTGAVTGAMVSSTYELSPYDVVDVSVYGEEDLHTRTRLGSDGTVLLPLVGNVDLAGKTVAEANDLIRKKYSDGGFVKDPHILITVIEYRKNTFSILGEINRPGIYEIPEGTHLSIVDAVLMAGGFTRIAWKNHVHVKRTAKGKATVTTVKVAEMADHPDVAPYEVHAGDVITVPESWY
jgi:polysaccharide export outer membrane protein